MRDALGPRASPDLSWLADLLWGGLEGITVTLNGAPPAGSRTVEGYRVLTSAREPALLVPVARRPAVAALRAAAGTRSNATRRRRAAAAAVVAAGLGGVVFRDRLQVHAATGTTADRLATVLGDVLGSPALLAVNVRPPTPSRKPVVQVIDEGVGILAYAKVGWSDGTDERLAAEGRALTALAASPGTVGAPAVRHLGSWRGHALVVTDPMPGRLRRWEDAAPPPVAATRDVVDRLGGGGIEAYGISPVRIRLRERWEDAARTGAEPRLADAVGDLLEALDRSAEVRLEFGGWHGDWSPWNLGLDEGRVVAWDWEHSGGDVPAGLDLPHFAFQVAFIDERRPVAEAFTRARETGGPLLRSFGCSAEQAELSLGVHVAEVALRYLDAAADGAPPNPRFSSEGPAAVIAEAARHAGR